MKIVLLLCIIGMLFFAFAPGQFTPAYIVNHDKIAHALVFCGISFFIQLSFKSIPVFKVIFLAFSLGLFIEAIQFLFFNRGFSIQDLIYDGTGIMLYIIIKMSVQVFRHVFLNDGNSGDTIKQ